MLFSDYTGRISTLSSTVATNDSNNSNFVRASSNLLFTDYTGRISTLSSTVATNDSNNSNFVRASSNLLFTDYTGRISTLSSTVATNDSNNSNFVRASSNLLFTDYTGRLSTLSSTVATNDSNVSNFVNINKYTDDKVKTVLSASAGNNMVWNNGTKKFDVTFDGNYNSLTNKLTAGNNVVIDSNNVVSANLDSYNGTATINGNLVVNSNLIVSGATTTLNTDLYTTEKLDITNVGSGPSLSITQASQTNNIMNVSNYANSEVFNITKDGYINFTERINGINITQFSKIANIDSNDTNNSNFVRSSSNLLFTDYTGRISTLSSTVATNDTNNSNFVRSSSNLLFTDYTGRISTLSSTVATNDTNNSNFVRASSNLLFTDYVARIATATSSVWTTSGTNIYNNNTNNVGIGTTNPTAYKLQVVGTIGASGNIVASYSDERLKNVTEYIKDVLPILNNINVFRYNCNDVGAKYGYDKNKKELGLSAQEIQKYYPELVSMAPFDSDYDPETQKIVSKSGENYITICYERLVPVLIQGIKELNNVTIAQESRINSLESRLEKLEKVIQ
jgi:hypothetical protein